MMGNLENNTALIVLEGGEKSSRISVGGWLFQRVVRVPTLTGVLEDVLESTSIESSWHSKLSGTPSLFFFPGSGLLLWWAVR